MGKLWFISRYKKSRKGKRKWKGNGKERKTPAPMVMLVIYRPDLCVYLRGYG
jgi:hypothetical protein